MPKPLSKISPKGGAPFFVSPTPGTDRPVFGPLIANVIAVGAHLESWTGFCLARILGANAEVGLAMYMALTSTAAQRAVASAAANSALKGDELELFSALLRLASKASAPRNIVAHAIWGFSPDVRDAILLLPPRMLLEHQGKIETTGNTEHALDMSAIMVYTQQDFLDIAQMTSRIRNHFQSFWAAIEPSLPAQEREQLRQKLSNEPDVQTELSRTRKDRKSNP